MNACASRIRSSSRTADRRSGWTRPERGFALTSTSVPGLAEITSVLGRAGSGRSAFFTGSTPSRSAVATRMAAMDLLNTRSVSLSAASEAASRPLSSGRASIGGRSGSERFNNARGDAAKTVLELAGRRLRLISTVNGRVWGFTGASSVRFRRVELFSIPGGSGAYARAFKLFAERQNKQFAVISFRGWYREYRWYSKVSGAHQGGTERGHKGYRHGCAVGTSTTASAANWPRAASRALEHWTGNRTRRLLVGSDV
jgi:hypothetical protein